MEIFPLGHASFKIRGKKVTLVTDPFDPQMLGIKFPKVEAEIVTISHQHQDHNFLAGVGGSPFLISGPGEYEVKGVRITGIPTFHDNLQGAKRGKNTLYRIEMDGLSLVHCGDLGETLKEKELEAVDGVDILFLPTGGFYTLSLEEAKKVIAEIEPKIVIPMHYLTPALNQEIFGRLTSLSAFLKIMGKEEVIPLPKLTVTKERLPEETQIIVLES